MSDLDKFDAVVKEQHEDFVRAAALRGNYFQRSNYFYLATEMHDPMDMSCVWYYMKKHYKYHEFFNEGSLLKESSVKEFIAWNDDYDNGQGGFINILPPLTNYILKNDFSKNPLRLAMFLISQWHTHSLDFLNINFHRLVHELNMPKASVRRAIRELDGKLFEYSEYKYSVCFDLNFELIPSDSPDKGCTSWLSFNDSRLITEATICPKLFGNDLLNRC